MKIKTNGHEISLYILPLSQVVPHEAIIQKLLDSLKHDMKRTGFQRDPIIIDERSKVALDGMHRRAALESFGAKFSLCAGVDYYSDDVKLERWLRYVIAPSRRLVKSLASALELKICSSAEEALSSVDGGECGIALLSARECFVSAVPFSNNHEERVHRIYEKVLKFDKICDAFRVPIDYIAEGEKQRLFSSEAVYMLYPTPLTKKDIVQLARRREVLPCKTTRHILPIRPMGVHFPLRMLEGNDVEDCERILDRIVSDSSIEMHERDIWYEGRRYSEPLAVFRRDNVELNHDI